MTSNDAEISKRKRMLNSGYIVHPDSQKILYNDGEMIQWIEEMDEGVYSLHIADFDNELDRSVFELDNLLKALKEFGINLTKEQ